MSRKWPLARIRPAEIEQNEDDNQHNAGGGASPPAPPHPPSQTPQPEAAAPRRRRTPNITDFNPQPPPPSQPDTLIPRKVPQTRRQAPTEPSTPPADSSLTRRLQELAHEGVVDRDEVDPPTNPEPASLEGDNLPDGAEPGPEIQQDKQRVESTAQPDATPRPRFFTSDSERKFSKQKGVTKPRLDGTPTQSSPPPKRKTHSFSNPKPGDFSYRRRKPDINALRSIMESLGI